GVELGAVLCAATATHTHLLTHDAGRLLRVATGDDDAAATVLASRAQGLLDDGTCLARDLAVPVQILDVDVLLEGGRAILQYLGPADTDISPLADALAARHDVLVLFENLALPTPPADEGHGGCDDPNCGRAN